MRRGLRRRVAILSCLVLLAACELAGPQAGVLFGGRQWIVTVTNLSARPATLFVAEDDRLTPGAMGTVVGTANPSTVPPGATVDVTFGVPRQGAWSIWVNPGPRHGALVVARDVPPDASGVMPFKIEVQADGSAAAEVPDLPGYFGN